MVSVTLEHRPIKVNVVTPRRVVKLDGVGLPGTTGLSAFEVWQRQPGNENKTEADFFDWIADAQIAEVLPYLNAAQAARDEAIASALVATNNAAASEQARQAAEASAAAALSSQTAAELSEATAELAKLAAIAAKDTSEALIAQADAYAAAAGQAADIAVAAKTIAQTASNEAANSASEALLAKQAAEAAQATVAQSALEAETAKLASEAAQIAAEAAQADAALKAQAAQASMEAAQSTADTSTSASAQAILAQEQAAASALAAEQAQTTAAASAVVAVNAEAAAEAAKVDAEAKSAIAVTKAAEAVAAGDAAEAAKVAAQAVEAQTLTYRNEALQYRNEAENFRNQAAEIVGGDFLSESAANLLYRRLDALLAVSDVEGLQGLLNEKTSADDVRAIGDGRYYQKVEGETVATREWSSGQFRLKTDQATKTEVGLEKVENLAPSEMPVSVAQQEALDQKLNSGALDIDPSLAANSDEKVATQKAVKAFVQTALDAIMAGDIQTLQDDLAALALVVGNKQEKLGFTPADATDTYTKGEVDAAFDALPDPPAVPTFATAAEVRAGTVDGKVISPKVAADAQANVVIARADAAIGINFDSLINATITLDANGTLGPPSGGYPGKSGVFSIINASGTASLAFNAAYRMPKGGITLESGVNAATRIPYMIGGAGAVILFPASKWSA